MAKAFTIWYHAFCPLRTPKSLQILFWCLGCTESRETSNQLQSDEPPQAGVFFLFPPFTSFSMKSLFPFCFQLHIAWTLLSFSILSPPVLNSVNMGVNKVFISVWLLIGKKFPVLLYFFMLYSGITHKTKSGFIHSHSNRQALCAAMKSSKEESLWRLKKKYYCLRMFWFKMWNGRKEITHITGIFNIPKIFQEQEKKKESSGKNQANWTFRAQGKKRRVGKVQKSLETM